MTDLPSTNSRYILSLLMVILTRIGVAAIILFWTLWPLLAEARLLRLACGAKNTTWEYCRQSAERWAVATGIPVEVIATPADSLEMLGYYQQQLAAGADTIDVLLTDALSLPLLYSYLLPLSHQVPEHIRARFTPALLEASHHNGRLYGLPWYGDQGLLYYRQDLLNIYDKPVPATWDELLETGLFIANREQKHQKKKLYAYTFQGRVSESLSCNAAEWIYSHSRLTAGSELPPLASLPAVTIADALATAQRLLTTGSPPASLTYNEEDSRMLFQNGQAVFMRNWTYAWALLQAADSPVRGKIGLAPLPAGSGGNAVSVQGGWFFALNRASPLTDAALNLILHLTSAEEQKVRTLQLGLQPSLPALLEDSDILAAQPHLAVIKRMPVRLINRLNLTGGVPYTRFSDTLRQTTHRVLWQTLSPVEAADILNRTPPPHRLGRQP